MSVWVEMWFIAIWKNLWKGHAPRERVSWNLSFTPLLRGRPVTLHVSVWVEIAVLLRIFLSTSSRSTWACELKWSCQSIYNTVVWSRSTWACELKFINTLVVTFLSSSRSTWACELKFLLIIDKDDANSHAPRERVSWNSHKRWFATTRQSHAPRERVSWNFQHLCQCRKRKSHAPRERVSWNVLSAILIGEIQVTLHVSVWVEIPVWTISWHLVSRHAPRERVSWNLHCRTVFPWIG